METSILKSQYIPIHANTYGYEAKVNTRIEDARNTF